MEENKIKYLDSNNKEIREGDILRFYHVVEYENTPDDIRRCIMPVFGVVKDDYDPLTGEKGLLVQYIDDGYIDQIPTPLGMVLDPAFSFNSVDEIFEELGAPSDKKDSDYCPWDESGHPISKRLLGVKIIDKKYYKYKLKKHKI